MDKLGFVFVIHNHQPVGNFDFVMEKAHSLAYKPFWDVFSSFDLKISLHISGPLFNWLRKFHPEYIENVRNLVAKGRVEILGSGYYEPVLAAIPESDAVEQLALYKETLEATFQDKVTGAWLTERVWEPHLPRICKRAGVDYITVDDYHFLRSGFSSEELDGYYLTEVEGDTVAVYPGNETLRYIMPFRVVEDIGAYFGQVRDKGIKTLIFADDGEKFGIWPETHKWVYDEGWLKKFFAFLSDNSDWIETKTLREHYNKNEPKGCCYLPTTSYPELGEWALPADASHMFKKTMDRLKQSPDFYEVKPFLQGGQWKNFLVKYRESRIMHRKMLFLSQHFKNMKKEEKHALFSAQCNDAYWHGVFGGLYLPHLRREINSNLIMAMKQVFKEPAVKYFDFDLDGKDEVFIINKDICAIFDPHDGGTLLSLDYLPKDLNLTDTITRRREAYHLRLFEACNDDKTVTIHDQFKTKEAGLEKLLHYDKYPRTSFRVHLFDDISIERLNNPASTVFHPISSAGYDLNLKNNAENVEVELHCREHDWECIKRCVMHNREMNCYVELKSSVPRKYAGMEWNFNLFAPDAADRYIVLNKKDRLPLNALFSYNDIETVSIVDEWYGVKVDLVPVNFQSLIIYPVYTVSLSEAGVEKTFQGTCLFFLGNLAQCNFSGKLSMAINNIG